MPEKVVIIGNGIAGVTAARHIRKFSDKEILIISAESEYFFSRTALMYIYMGHMKFEHTKPYEDHFWKKNNIQLLQAFIEEVNVIDKTLRTQEGETINYDQLILATGSQTFFRGWEGENLNGVQGLVTKQDLELLEKNSQHIKKAVIIGGGLIGVELAEMLHTRKVEVSILVRETGFWGSVLPKEEAQFISKHIQKNGIEILEATELDKIIGNKNNQVQSIVTKDGREISCDFVGICTGVKPNIDFLKDSGIQTNRGILVNKFLETNVKDVYAIGDCAEQKEPQSHRKSIEAVWYVGRMMGETVAQTICENKTAYQPGYWYNSAKFFEIEYQTYGQVLAKAEDHIGSFYWEDSKHEKAIHIQYVKSDETFLGINTFGIRMRHEVIDRWLSRQMKLEEVISCLKEANFDKEFSRKFEKQIQSSFQEQYSKVI
ncbi:pyridine nucleotide-disulfide oxidoreductase [Mesonia algae]|uniref:Pyridine nucleotide-disulfide oxidoreductase n=1 Tax=Mesonia algae TaxID=213248 RepID=A0A2W7IM22_9FLAO|nr:NAD(P)/FAD-dependent oxidoreductase [Mesonia algae]PZW39653.1 pyridine nucleotide-disulfide oxidoreductase [Mesonia algae]